MAKFDDILIDINDFGRYQKLRYFLICLAGLLPPISTYVYSFLAPNIYYECDAERLDNSSRVIDQCHYELNGTTHKCTSWVYDRKYFEWTLTEEWNMVCDRSFLKSNIQSIYFTGYLVGSLVLGNLADRIGRRPVMLLSFILIFLGALGSALTPSTSMFGLWASYCIFTICRFMIACGTRGINETGYVLATELVSSSKRTKASIGFEHFFSLGQLLLAFTAFFVRDWRLLAIVMIFPTIPFLSYQFFIPESPRWLLSKNRSQKALVILERVAKTNKRSLNKTTWTEFINCSTIQENNETIIDFVKTRYGIMLLSIMFLNWLVNNLVFYGVSLNSLDLGVNPYLSFAISASVELIACTTTLLTIEKLGRKRPYFMFLFAAAVSCILKTCIGNVIAGVVVAMLGKFCVSASYAILRLYSNEIFPTSIRGGLIGACSMVSRMGVIIVPIINSLSTTVWKPMPFLIFGIAGLLASASVVFLPETAGKTLPDTIADSQRLNSLRLFGKTKKSKSENLDLITKKAEINVYEPTMVQA